MANKKIRILLVEDEPLTDVFELKEMVKSFVLNFGNPGEEGVVIYNSLPSSMKSYVSLNLYPIIPSRTK